MKIPGPDHPITLEPCRGRVQAAFAQHVIADTDDALVVRECDYPPVVYFPMDDVDMAFLAKTDRSTTCPYKGHASYWTIYMDGRLAENSVWAYEDPYPAMAALRGRVAFYPNVVEVYEIDEADQQRAPTLVGDAGSSTP